MTARSLLSSLKPIANAFAVRFLPCFSTRNSVDRVRKHASMNQTFSQVRPMISIVSLIVLLEYMKPWMYFLERSLEIDLLIKVKTISELSEDCVLQEMNTHAQVKVLMVLMVLQILYCFPVAGQCLSMLITIAGALTSMIGSMLQHHGVVVTALLCLCC